ncbi:MAG: DUF3298 domain-containing protein [Proteocatella sp.]
MKEKIIKDIQIPLGEADKDNPKIDLEMLETLKREYENTEIPSELEDTVKASIEKSKSKKEMPESGNIEELKNISRYSKKEHNKMKKTAKNTIAAAAAIAVMFTGAVNVSPSFAESMMKVPVIGGIVRVINFSQYKYDKDTYNANMDAPIIDGLQDEELQKTLNSKYLEANKKLFEEFEKDVAKMEEFGDGGHLGVDTGYVIKTNNDEILSIGRYYVNTVGSSSTTFTYDTIDKKNEIVITLPSLFKDESYVDKISKNIIEQMTAQTEADEEKSYWIKGNGELSEDAGFEKIKSDQQFYVNEEGKLVISFDKYEVAAGYMGVIEFEIPTEVIQDVLVSKNYIK